MMLELTRLPFQARLSIGVFHLVKRTAARKGGIIIVSQAAERDCVFHVKVESESEIGIRIIGIVAMISLIIGGHHHQSRVALVIAGIKSLTLSHEGVVVLIPRRRKGLISPCALKESFRIILKPHVELEVLGIVRDIEQIAGEIE